MRQPRQSMVAPIYLFFFSSYTHNVDYGTNIIWTKNDMFSKYQDSLEQIQHLYLYCSSSCFFLTHDTNDNKRATVAGYTLDFHNSCFWISPFASLSTQFSYFPFFTGVRPRSRTLHWSLGCTSFPPIYAVRMSFSFFLASIRMSFSFFLPQSE